MVFISKPSEHEIIMLDTLDEIVRMMELTPLRMEDARRIINEGYNLLQKCEELRKSRDNHKNKFDELNLKFKALKNGN